MLFDFRLRSPDIFGNHVCLMKPERGNFEVYIVYIYICAPGSVLDSPSCCGSFGIASILQQFRATSTCCILTFSFIGGTSVLEFL